MDSTIGLNAPLHHQPATQPRTPRRCSQWNSLISNPSGLFLFAILICREIPKWRWSSVWFSCRRKHWLHPKYNLLDLWGYIPPNISPHQKLASVLMTKCNTLMRGTPKHASRTLASELICDYKCSMLGVIAACLESHSSEACFGYFLTLWTPLSRGGTVKRTVPWEICLPTSRHFAISALLQMHIQVT